MDAAEAEKRDKPDRREVVFALRDATFPPPNEILRLAGLQLFVVGEVVGFSDQGEVPRSLALVQSESLPIVVVAISKLRGVTLCNL